VTAVPPPSTAIFAKCPRPGRVKTRLAHALSPEGACALAATMLDDLVGRLAPLSGQEFHLVIDPPEERSWFEERYPGVGLAIQSGADLGSRLGRWFDTALEDHPHAVVIGADCPALPGATVREAHSTLAAGADVVLAPDRGGGYALVGLRRRAPELFDVPMSRADNLERTLDRARELGLEVRLLPPVRDVDHPVDLLDLERELRDRGEGPDHPVRTALHLRRLLPLLQRSAIERSELGR